MYEYVAFNPYNSSPEALAAELTKKSAEGWEVVSIVPTFDGRYCAFLRRPNAETGTTTSTYTSTTTPFPSTTQVATTAYVIGQLSSTTPAAIAAAGAVGTGTTFARADHTHSGVTSITGTSNQVTASASAGAVTLSLPQSIATSWHATGL